MLSNPRTTFLGLAASLALLVGVFATWRGGALAPLLVGLVLRELLSVAAHAAARDA